MKRIGILTAGGDTPALNATIHGAVERANQLNIEVVGLIKGYNSLYNQRLPHVVLNPLFQEIPELDPAKGGTILGSSRDYVDPNQTETLELIEQRLRDLRIEGLICIGGDGTLNGLQPLADRLPVVLAPKTIDNDLGLNYRSEPDHYIRTQRHDKSGFDYRMKTGGADFLLDYMVNYVTPGYATAVFVAVQGIQRIRTTAESHRRIAIIEVMGRHSGYIALGSTYGQPDIVLVPESPLNLDLLVEQIKDLYDLQKNVVIVCGEGIVDASGRDLGAEISSTDPAGNKVLTGASEALRQLLIERIGDEYFTSYRRGNSATEAIFTRKVGHTQRGGRPLLFDRFYGAQLGAKALEVLVEGRTNVVATLQWNSRQGFWVDSHDANGFRDRWGHIHARKMHPSFYNPSKMKPSDLGREYLKPIFANALGQDDLEYQRLSTFSHCNLTLPYHSINTDIQKRIKYVC
jgi:6-phosphofructokinase 1